MPTTETRAQVAKGATETGAPLAKGATETNFFGKRRYRESNSGPSHYECDALPLSYSAGECCSATKLKYYTRIIAIDRIREAQSAPVAIPFEKKRHSSDQATRLLSGSSCRSRRRALGDGRPAETSA